MNVLTAVVGICKSYLFSSYNESVVFLMLKASTHLEKIEKSSGPIK